MPRTFAALGWLCVLPLAATNSYVGSEACASCHAALYEQQVSSRHALALRPILDSPLPQGLQQRSLRERGGVEYSYQRVEGGLLATAIRHESDISRAIEDQDSLLLEWAFGAGSQGLTAVGRRGGRFVEHRVSFYPRLKRPAITLGHPMPPPKAARDLLGVDQPQQTAFRCFNCHATNVQQDGSKLDFSAMETGVRCERCHGPGADHIAAASAGDVPAARRLISSTPESAADSVAFCGQCHRNPKPNESAVRSELEDPLTVRFQPIGLTASRCFQKSKALSCVTCHDPHQNAKTEASFYRRICLDCHSGQTNAAVNCPRDPGGDCLACHMRRTEPTPNLTFTDHRIRVYAEAKSQ